MMLYTLLRVDNNIAYDLTMRKTAPIMTAFIFTSRSIGTAGTDILAYKNVVLQYCMHIYINTIMHCMLLTLDTKVIRISEVLFGQPRPLLGDLPHLLFSIH